VSENGTFDFSAEEDEDKIDEKGEGEEEDEEDFGLLLKENKHDKDQKEGE